MNQTEQYIISLQTQSAQKFIKTVSHIAQLKISFRQRMSFGLDAKTHKHPDGLSCEMYYQLELHLMEEMSEEPEPLKCYLIA